jgi:hypothetical protein
VRCMNPNRYLFDSKFPSDRDSSVVDGRDTMEERVPGLGRSPARPFCNSISGFSRMPHGISGTSDAVNNDVRVRAAAGSHHPPNPWPWPHRWACVGTSCRTGCRRYTPSDCGGQDRR